MNERIKELAGQAKCMAEETINKQISKNAELDAFAEKFAELIVRECMEVVGDGKYSADECRGNTHRIAHNNARSEASSDIKKHFGVEE
jgi:hypothetical protein